MVSSQQIIDRVTQQNKDLRSGTYVSDAFNLVNKHVWHFVGITFFIVVVGGLLDNIPYLGSVINYLIISPCLTAGIYLACKDISENVPLEFGRFFDGFNYIGQLFLVYIIQFGVLIAFILPVGLIMFIFVDSADSLFSSELALIISTVCFIVLFIPAVYIMVSWLYATFFVIYYNFPAWESLETSRKIISQFWFHFFCLALLILLVALLGLLGCVVMMLYTIPVGYVAIFLSFKDIVGLPGDNVDDVFGDFSANI